MPLFTMDPAINWTGIFSSFKDVWNSVTSFVASEPVLLSIVAVPLAVGFIAIIMKAIR